MPQKQPYNPPARGLFGPLAMGCPSKSVSGHSPLDSQYKLQVMCFHAVFMVWWSSDLEQIALYANMMSM
eukprot:1211796-Alexandrium_andersonii.AAC.1